MSQSMRVLIFTAATLLAFVLLSAAWLVTELEVLRYSYQLVFVLFFVGVTLDSLSHHYRRSTTRERKLFLILGFAVVGCSLGLYSAVIVLVGARHPLGVLPWAVVLVPPAIVTWYLAREYRSLSNAGVDGSRRIEG